MPDQEPTGAGDPSDVIPVQGDSTAPAEKYENLEYEPGTRLKRSSLFGSEPLFMAPDEESTYEPPPPPPPPTGDQTGGDPDVITIEGDSSSAQDDIYADPGLGDRGDPPPPPPPPVPILEPESATQGATFATLPAEPAPQGRPWLMPTAIAVVVLVGAIGFALTRGGAEQTAAAPSASAAPSAPPRLTGAPTLAPTPAQTAAPAAAAVRITDTKITEQGNVCLNATTFIFSIKTEGAKAGDAVHVKISGPGLPTEANGSLGADGTMSLTIGVAGPVKGNQQWSAQVDQIAGKPVVSGPSQVFGFCPTG